MKTMLEASVLGTEPFLETIRLALGGANEEALARLRSLRVQYSNDAYSKLEIDRWVSRMLEKLGREEEALALLRELEPRLEGLQYDMSTHYLAVVTLQNRLGRL